MGEYHSQIIRYQRCAQRKLSKELDAFNLPVPFGYFFVLENRTLRGQILEKKPNFLHYARIPRRQHLNVSERRSQPPKYKLIVWLVSFHSIYALVFQPFLELLNVISRSFKSVGNRLDSDIRVTPHVM